MLVLWENRGQRRLSSRSLVSMAAFSACRDSSARLSFPASVRWQDGSGRPLRFVGTGGAADGVGFFEVDGCMTQMRGGFIY